MSNKKAKGKRAKTRSQMKRRMSNLTVNKLLQEFDSGSKVVIDTDPSVHSGMPFRRYHGKIGKVLGKQGNAFKVEVSSKTTKKELVLHPAHLKLLEGKVKA